MSDSSSFLVEKLALQYDIDPYTANICIQEALSKILEKEVISTDSGYAYYSTVRSNNRLVFTWCFKYLYEWNVQLFKFKYFRNSFKKLITSNDIKGETMYERNYSSMGVIPMIVLAMVVAVVLYVNL